MDETPHARGEALRHFQRARRRAVRDQLAGRMTGKDTRMLPFETIRSELRKQNPMYRGVQEIPTDQIVGSVGRYREFTRKFLPLNDSLQERWVNVDSLASTKGWPPIAAYEIGGAYFVRDGNHRVSVARELNIPSIEAHVWAFPGNVHISPDDKLDDVLIRLGEERFMEQTRLNEWCPDHGIRFTSPGRYTELLAQIHNLRNILAQIDGEPLPYEEAVKAWYEMVYLPTIQVIRDNDLLAGFPGCTEADLFVWLSKYRALLRETYGEYDNLAELARMLADKHKESGLNKITRQIRRWLGSDELPPLADPELDNR
ncbi:MAG: hypothetical protein ACE5E7_18220 [Anaerolineae bacterium]